MFFIDMKFDWIKTTVEKLYGTNQENTTSHTEYGLDYRMSIL